MLVLSVVYYVHLEGGEDEDAIIRCGLLALLFCFGHGDYVVQDILIWKVSVLDQYLLLPCQRLGRLLILVSILCLNIQRLFPVPLWAHLRLLE